MIGTYFEKADTYLAVKFNRVGDPVNAGDPIFPQDPRTLQAYQREGVHHAAKCIHCHKPASLHAFIEALQPPPPPMDANLRVDLATGKHVAKQEAQKAPYPKRFVRTNEAGQGMDEIVVEHPVDEEKATEAGFRSVVGFPKTMVKKANLDDKGNQPPDEERIVDNGVMEQKAIHEGFVLLTPPVEEKARAIMEKPGSPVPDGYPGKSELEYAAIPDAYPKTMVKKAYHSADPHNQAPDETRTAHNKDEEEKFAREGFAVVDAPSGIPAPAASAYPKTLTKFGSPNRTVENEDDEKKASEEGYRAETVVCPGNMILFHRKTLAIFTCDEGAFNSLYERT